MSCEKRDESTMSAWLIRQRESAMDARIHLMGTVNGVHAADLPKSDPANGARNRAEYRRAVRRKRRAS